MLIKIGDAKIEKVFETKPEKAEDKISKTEEFISEKKEEDKSKEN